METKTDEKTVCPRCSGKGEIAGFRHVKAGICFNCWGCGEDLGGEIRTATRLLGVARGKWVTTNQRLKRTAPGTTERSNYERALADIEKSGKRLARRLENLIQEREFYSARHKES